MTEVLINDFPDIRTSAASTTSSASAASMASTTSEALVYQKLPDLDDWIVPGTKMTNGGPFLWNGSSKIISLLILKYGFCKKLLW